MCGLHAQDCCHPTPSTGSLPHLQHLRRSWDSTSMWLRKSRCQGGFCFETKKEGASPTWMPQARAKASWLLASHLLTLFQAFLMRVRGFNHSRHFPQLTLIFLCSALMPSISHAYFTFLCSLAKRQKAAPGAMCQFLSFFPTHFFSLFSPIHWGISAFFAN